MENVNKAMKVMEEKVIAFEMKDHVSLLNETQEQLDPLRGLSQEEKMDLDLAIQTKMHALRMDGPKALRLQQLKDYLVHMKWKHSQKLSLCEAIESVYEISASDVFEYLRYRGIVEAKHLQLTDFEDLITK